MQTAADFTSLYAAALREHAAGRHERAIAHYRAALTVLPDHAEAHANLGTALLSLERPDEAIVCYRAALESDPFLDGVHGPLGMALSATGAHADACAFIELALAAAPENADLHFYVGLYLFELCRFAYGAAY